MNCPGSLTPAPAMATGMVPCSSCGTLVALTNDPTGWGGAVYADHPSPYVYERPPYRAPEPNPVGREPARLRAHVSARRRR